MHDEDNKGCLQIAKSKIRATDDLCNITITSHKQLQDGPIDLRHKNIADIDADRYRLVGKH